MDSGVEFVAVDNPHANKLTVHILAAVAQHERELIAQRTRDALQAAKARGVGVVALLGKTGGHLRELADLSLIVPADDTARIQELHLAIEHVICDLVEERLRAG